MTVRTMRDMLDRADGYVVALAAALSEAHGVKFKVEKAHENTRATCDADDDPNFNRYRYSRGSLHKLYMGTVSATVGECVLRINFHNHGRGHLYAVPSINYRDAATVHEKGKAMNLKAIVDIVALALDNHAKAQDAAARRAALLADGKAALDAMNVPARLDAINHADRNVYVGAEVRVVEDIADTFSLRINVSAATLDKLLAALEGRA